MKKKNMNMKGLMSLALIMLLAIIATSVPVDKVEAAEKYITVGDYIKLVIKEAGIKVDTSENDPYIAAAISVGIVKAGEFTNYSSNITRTDAAVIINRADEYLYGTDTVNETLFNFVYKERISDLKSIEKSKRTDVAKTVAKGFIAGYSNGYYVKNRSFRGAQKITLNGAKSVIAMLNNKEKRLQLSPDGLLIRTTKLPKNADKYEYILSYLPNSFYEKKYIFEYSEGFDPNKITDSFKYPVRMKSATYKNLHKEFPMSEVMEKNLYEWARKAEVYLSYVFNVDYRTVNDEWVEGLASTFSQDFERSVSNINKYYIPDMKKNKVVVKASSIIVEPSTLTYSYVNGYTMKCYVKYKITCKSTNMNLQDILYSQHSSYLKNLKSGEWRIGIFEVKLKTTNSSNGDGSDWQIDSAVFFID